MTRAAPSKACKSEHSDAMRLAELRPPEQKAGRAFNGCSILDLTGGTFMCGLLLQLVL